MFWGNYKQWTRDPGAENPRTRDSRGPETEGHYHGITYVNGMKWTAKVVVAIISLVHGPAQQGICVTGTIHGPPWVPGPGFTVYSFPMPCTAVHVMQCLGQLDTPPKIFFHARIHIATAHPVFLLPYYGLRKRSIAMCVS